MEQLKSFIMDQKNRRILGIILIIVLVIIFIVIISGGSKESKIVGTWDTHGEGDLSFTDDGTFYTYGEARGTYEVSGDQLILTYYRGSVDTFTIDELTKDTLVVTGGGSGKTQICNRIN